MQKVSYRHKLLIIVPPLLLIVIGLFVYFLVLRIITPETKQVSALPQSQATDSSTPQSSSSAQTVNPIETSVVRLTSEEVDKIQLDADKGIDVWRYDVMDTAEQVAGKYGFTPGDQLTLMLEEANENPRESASVIAVHGDQSYILTLSQPGIKGDKGIWVLEKIEQR